MSFERREYVGAAPATTLASGIDSNDLSISLTDGTGWPTGSTGPFAVVIGRGTASEEKVLCDSRTSNTLTVNASGRGYDDTSGAAHSAGETIEHCVTSVDLDEANQHIADTALDHHTQYLNTSRHAAVSHTAAMLGTDSVTTVKIEDGAVTTAKLGADAVDGTKIADDSIDSEHYVDGSIDTAHIADDAVTGAKLLPGIEWTEVSVGATGSTQPSGLTTVTGMTITITDPGYDIEYFAFAQIGVDPATESDLTNLWEFQIDGPTGTPQGIFRIPILVDGQSMAAIAPVTQHSTGSDLTIRGRTQRVGGSQADLTVSSSGTRSFLQVFWRRVPS